MDGRFVWGSYSQQHNSDIKMVKKNLIPWERNRMGFWQWFQFMTDRQTCLSEFPRHALGVPLRIQIGSCSRASSIPWPTEHSEQEQGVIVDCVLTDKHFYQNSWEFPWGYKLADLCTKASSISWPTRGSYRGGTIGVLLTNKSNGLLLAVFYSANNTVHELQTPQYKSMNVDPYVTWNPQKAPTMYNGAGKLDNSQKYILWPMAQLSNRLCQFGLKTATMQSNKMTRNETPLYGTGEEEKIMSITWSGLVKYVYRSQDVSWLNFSDQKTVLLYHSFISFLYNIIKTLRSICFFNSPLPKETICQHLASIQARD